MARDTIPLKVGRGSQISDVVNREDHVRPVA